MNEKTEPRPEFGIGLYSAKVAARVSRIPPERFAAWTRARLLHPIVYRINGKSERVYTYKDLLLLRLIARLRQLNISARSIRISLEVLRDVYESDPHGWMKATLYVVDRILVAITHRDEWNPLAVSKGGQKIALVFFPELVNELQKELLPTRFQHISIDPNVLGGAPVIKNTRIPTRVIAMLKEEEQNPLEIYPALTKEAVEEALEYEKFLVEAV